MTRIAFTADLHVDNYGSRIDPATGLNARLVDYLDTLAFVARTARERGCDALVVAGDVTERKHVNSWMAGKIGVALSAGPERQVFLRGNHDGEIAGESIATVLARMSPDWDAHPRPGVSLVDDTAICCIPHLDARWLRTLDRFADVAPEQVNVALAEEFLAIARGLYAATEKVPRRILVVHQGLSGGRMSETQAAFLGDRSLVVDASALGAIGFDAVVAGHFHKHQVLSTDPLTLYPGSIERVDFAEEAEPKGFVIVDTDDLPAFEWVETPVRRYVTIDGSTPWGHGAPPDVAGAIVRLVDVPPEIDIAELRRALEAAGAFEVTEIRRSPVEQPEIAGGLAEGLSAGEALEAYFAGDPDREALVARGRDLLEAVA